VTTAARDPADGGVFPPARRRRAYAALVLGTILAVLDGSIANVALPTIGRELHASPAATVWVVNAFSLAVTAALFGTASFAQSRGITKAYLAGVIVFTLGSLACAVSTTLSFLILARVAQGIGAAITMAISPALLRVVFPRSQMGYAFGLNAMFTSAAGAAGPTIGGLILAVLPWPWLFAVNVPIAIAILFVARGALPDIPPTHDRVDLISVATSAVGFAGLVYGLDGFARGERWPVAVAELVVSGLIFAWFVRRQFVLPRPMIALDLFRLPRFALAANCSFAAWTAWGVAVIALPFFLQVAYGVSPVVSGLLMTPWPIANALVAAAAGRFADRTSVHVVAVAGLIVFTAGLIAFALGTALHANVFVLSAVSAVCGGGFGIFQAPNNREIMDAGPIEKSGSASALFATLRVGAQTFGASAVAIAFALFETSTGSNVPAVYLHLAVPAAFWFAVACALAALAISLRRTRSYVA
jgi:DHA2 family multidrug resistance protein-like MFS transporter